MSECETEREREVGFLWNGKKGVVIDFGHC